MNESMNPASPSHGLAELGSRVRQLVEQVEREREGLTRTAEPLQRPIASIAHWQHLAHRVIPLIPVILAAAAGVVLLLWISGRWNHDRVRRWIGFALEAYALWRSLHAVQGSSPDSPLRRLLP